MIFGQVLMNSIFYYSGYRGTYCLDCHSDDVDCSPVFYQALHFNVKRSIVAVVCTLTQPF
jgi:hypothetical protein